LTMTAQTLGDLEDANDYLSSLVVYYKHSNCINCWPFNVH
jgi:hypothetical protein